MSEQGYRDFASRVEHVCAQYADKTAIVYMRNDGSRTEFAFGKIFEHICAAKEKFADVGLRPGDRAAIIAPHSPYAIIAGLALGCSNITSVLIDTALPTQEINRLLEFSDVRAVFTVSSKYDCLEVSIVTDIPVFNIVTIAEDLIHFEDSATEVKRGATTDPHFDVITILFSSGTTSSVKGVMVTYQSVINSCKLYLINTGLKAHMDYLLVLPFSHVAGYSGTIHHLINGCEIGMIEDVDASKLVKGLTDFQPVFFAMVPRVYELIEEKIRKEINKKGKHAEKTIFRLFTLSAFFRKKLGINIGNRLFKNITYKVYGKNIYGLGTGGTSCKKSTAEFYLNLGLEWANFYSTTETFVPCVGTGIHDRYPAGTEGYVKRHPGIEIKISAPDENGIGEILVKTILIMKGYFRDPELTAASFDEDGYFKTGDLGYIDRKGYLHVTGRIKEAIMLHTGKKVAPSDVDSLYSEICPDLSIAACGVPNRDSTFDEIHLFIERGELSPDAQQETREKILDFSVQTSTLYQISGIHFIDKLPSTSVGKVKRFQLRELALSERGGK